MFDIPIEGTRNHPARHKKALSYIPYLSLNRRLAKKNKLTYSPPAVSIFNDEELNLTRLQNSLL